MIGFSFFSNKDHFARAVLESICYRTKDVIVSLKENNIECKKLKVDGGITNNEFIMKF